VTGARRATALPEVPTIAETIAGFESSSWQGWFVAAKTPREIVEFIQREIAKVLALPDVRDRLTAMVYEPVGGTPAEFDAYFKSEVS
jgi:tripartite-type tricarboxylate transporter receptor subunit TctC